jgi:hypothetical protein
MSDGNNGALSPQIQKPAQMVEEDAAMDEDIQCNNIPISNFKSNNIQNKERYIKMMGEMSPRGQQEINAPLSPGASFAMRDNVFKNENQK